MLTTEIHMGFIERQKTVTDEAGKAVARKVLAGMDLREMLTDRKTARKRFLTMMLKESEAPIDATLKLGRELFHLKFGDA